MISYKTPRKLVASRLSSFLYDLERIFKNHPHHQKNVVLWLDKTKKMDIAGMLVLYKFMDHTMRCNYFYNPHTNIEGSYIEQCLCEFGFKELINSIMNEDSKVIDKKYSALRLREEGTFIISPQVLSRSTQNTKDNLSDKHIKSIEKYYNYDKKVIQMIYYCFSEMQLNFWEHAIGDERSIIVAKGNKVGIDIACADMGAGIISTLSKIDEFKNSPPESIIRAAFNKEVTSKEHDDNHMGCGLWIVNETVSRSGGEMHVYSEGWYYCNKNRQINVYRTGYWKGTIIFIHLPTDKPTEMSDLLKIDTSLFKN